jgi:hypothetical protein
MKHVSDLPCTNCGKIKPVTVGTWDPAQSRANDIRKGFMCIPCWGRPSLVDLAYLRMRKIGKERAGQRVPVEQGRAEVMIIGVLDQASERINDLIAKCNKATAERDALREAAATADARASAIEHQLVTVRLRLERALGNLHYVAQSEQCGHPHGYSVIQIPDWETRQIIDSINEALRKAEV